MHRNLATSIDAIRNETFYNNIHIFPFFGFTATTDRSRIYVSRAENRYNSKSECHLGLIFSSVTAYCFSICQAKKNKNQDVSPTIDSQFEFIFVADYAVKAYLKYLGSCFNVSFFISFINVCNVSFNVILKNF